MARRSLPSPLAVVVLATACGSSPTPPDSGVDAGLDAGSDAGMDAGADAGSDAGTDAGFDAGQADAGLCPPGCAHYVLDGGYVYYPDGGAYCLC